MLTRILVKLQVFCCHSGKSRLLVAFLVILVVFFVLDWSYFGRLLTKSWSYFGRLCSNIWSYFYLTTLVMAQIYLNNVGGSLSDYNASLSSNWTELEMSLAIYFCI